ncbi:MAG: hypothetical protein WAX22_02990 [Lactococcus hircilactis]|uniref:hypothetical protein n=1 Tax=Lactococcus hircilactis TaxID=1494462 RepID=UPI003BE5AEDA
MASKKRRKNNSNFVFQKWTEAEDEKLYQLSNEDILDTDISEIMKRSVSAVTNRRYRLRERGDWEKVPEKIRGNI